MEDLVTSLTTGGGEAKEEQEPEAAAEEDPYFKRLPDGLIIYHIFNKISEAKSLCRCSLVSKRFSSLVYQITNVSVKIPLRIPHLELDKKTNPPRFPGIPVHCFIAPLGLFPIIQRFQRFAPHFENFDFKFLSRLICKFLAKFSRMESLHVGFLFPIVDSEATGGICFLKEPVVRWKNDFNSDNFIFLIASRSCHDDVNNIFSRETGLPIIEYDCHLAMGFYTFSLMETLFPFLPESLAQVVITDSKKRSKLHLGKSDLVHQRRRVCDNPRNTEYLNEVTSDKSEVEFPFSGPIADNVTLFLANESDEDDSYYDRGDYLTVKAAFEHKDEVFVEAVWEMVKEIIVSLRENFA